MTLLTYCVHVGATSGAVCIKLRLKRKPTLEKKNVLLLYMRIKVISLSKHTVFEKLNFVIWYGE